MSRREFLEWWEFHRRNPIDPVSIYQKPAALMAYTAAACSSGGTKRTHEDFLEMLVRVPEADEADKWFESL